MFRWWPTNDAHYLTEDDSRAHEILMCIGEGKTINDGTRTDFRQFEILCPFGGRNVADIRQGMS